MQLVSGMDIRHGSCHFSSSMDFSYNELMIDSYTNSGMVNRHNCLYPVVAWSFATVQSYFPSMDFR